MRRLLAQAITEGITLVTSDTFLDKYKVSVIGAS
jgi:PIN domain nuclease of toxin-antitoxin system